MKIRILKIVSNFDIRISNLVFYLLILLLPTQLGLHFWPDFAFIKGIRIDYLSPTLHVTDILIFLIFIFSVAKFPHNARVSRGKQFSILIFVISLIVGIFLSKSPQAGFFGLLKLLEFVFLGFYTAYNINKFKLQNILLIFSIGIIFESLLAISQYINHSSLQGIFYFFGERFFTSQTPGIANASLNGQLILRPYGTFPHPNVLAGYLTIVMTIVILNIKNKISKIRKVLYLSVLLIGTAALLLTLSRVAIILWVLVLGFFLIRKLIINHSRLAAKRASFVILALVALLILGSATPLGSRFTDLKLTDESIVQRESLIQNSIIMIKDNPLFGVGLNNFLINLPRNEIIQPVHNILFLIAAETGIIGFSFFIWFLLKTYQRVRSSYYLLLISCLLLLGLFDHYFLTLQQGQLLFSFVLGLIWSEKKT